MAMVILDTCIDCGKCAAACSSRLPVEKLIQIRSVECTACLDCVAVCPCEGALDVEMGIPLMAGSNWRVSTFRIAAGIAIIFFGIVGLAKATDHWQMKVVPYSVYQQLVPEANAIQHPSR